MIVAGAIVPHAPVLLRAVGGTSEATLGPLRAAAESLVFSGAEALIVFSPHGTSAGVYGGARGSLRPFGIADDHSAWGVDEDLSRALSDAWGEPMLDGELDHGCVVPLRLLQGVDVPVACAAVSETSSVDEAVNAGTRLAGAVAQIDRPVAFVASAHTCAALSARAPLGLRSEAVEAERKLIDWLATGSGDAGRILEDLARVGGSCGAAPLAAFARLFPGGARVNAYESPFGVGYLVASAAAE